MKKNYKKFEKISWKTLNAAARPFQEFLYRWENFCEPQHPFFSVTYVTPKSRGLIHDVQSDSM